MTKYDEWTPFRWHCSNCGNMVVGYKNEQGNIKVQCGRCGTHMVRTLITKTHDTIEVYAPKVMIHIAAR